MAFKVEKVSETSHSVEVGESLWLDASREKVVKEGDPDAAFLLASPGKRLSLEEAERYGLVGKSRKAKSPSEDKQAEPEEDKATVADIEERISDMSDEELAELESDERKGVQNALKAERARREEGGSE